MNMSPGGAQALLRPGKLHDGGEQKMVFEEGLENAGRAEGLKQVISEQGIDVTSHGL